MEIERAQAFLREHHRAVLSTFRPDGRPQMSAVSIAVDGEGRAVVSTRETAYKVRHLRRDPRVSVCAFSDDFWNWIQIDGTATVVSLPDAMEPLVEYYRSVQGEHPDWDEYRRAMTEQRRVIVRVDIERAGPNNHG
ncbi:MAG: PPOX class F420-dependent oxidoreductase [Actinomycetota bacterium]|nr:PPOX class F420-dependent oxidoreductase [Actinomycetota bacterium]